MASIKCQTHIASDFDGDSSGRFSGREYKLGDVMAWWPADDRRYDLWRTNGRKFGPTSGSMDEEACYATCANCSSDLCVVIEFEDRSPKSVVCILKETEWPAEYFR